MTTVAVLPPLGAPVWPGGRRYFRSTFDLPAGKYVASARLAVSADDRCVVWLNGERTDWIQESVPDRWAAVDFGASAWSAVQSIGPHGAKPWGNLVVGQQTAPPLCEAVNPVSGERLPPLNVTPDAGGDAIAKRPGGDHDWVLTLTRE